MNVRRYAIVTSAYWAFTLTDGALRMLVLLHFHELGFQPVQLAFLFLLYEACGVVTNLLGGWLASRKGLKTTLIFGLSLQIVSLLVLSFLQPEWGVVVSVIYIMATQALSGVAKDLTKMSAKSAVKVLVPAEESEAKLQSGLFRWVAILTGSKNALKGVGFLLGGVMLSEMGFVPSLWMMAGLLLVAWCGCVCCLKGDLGRANQKVKFDQLFSKSLEINTLSFSRVFLFASRDVWFVVGLPVFLSEALGWGHTQVGAFLAVWVIGYGCVQAVTPALVRKRGSVDGAVGAAFWWGLGLFFVSVGIAVLVQCGWWVTASILIGLIVFGVVFAMNSSLHSYLILAYTDDDQATLNVGFYYMANAIGRFFGTLLSGLVYAIAGLPACLWVSAGCVVVAVLPLLRLSRQ